jgi:SAM-dependent methyltransferase
MSADWEHRWRSGDTPWEKGAPAPPLVDYLAASRVEGTVLVPGCGAGHDARALAAQGARVTGVDLAPTGIARARAVPPVADETYVLGDFLDLAPEFHGAFDWVFEHTCFCAIHPSQRESYARSVSRALRPGGRLLAIFYISPDHDADGPPYRVAREELDAWFGAQFHAVHESVPVRAFPNREGRELLMVWQRKG